MPFLDVNNHQLHYADSHPNGAPTNGLTFVFIHGLGSSQNYYFAVMPHLTPNHRCIAVDTYGSARSTYTGQPVSIASIAADVIGVMDALKVSQAVVVGHSMGGLVVTLLGAQHADRIKAVVAIGPTHPSETLTLVMNKRSDTVSGAGMEPMANSIPYQATGLGASTLAKSFIRELVISQNPKGYAALCKAIANAPKIDYSAIKVPFLLIAGEEDKSASLEGCQYIFGRVSSENKKMEVLANVGHWHCVEAPDEVGKTISEFIDATKS
ncbi:Alpha/Beta hydrolase protein [Aspergillus avenaceus]|uniref:Alpha/Beta hydrolase protein n=1 Tax=Aspergillus avenaceus TaxID=36643 RepID=A0A5N6TDT3_ASPAV|nr:Alpha/Beta hydrolase protein [Aspergillus avenaceus]